MNIKSKIKDSRLLVKVKLSSNEEVSERELAPLAKGVIRGLMRVEQPKANQLLYIGPVAVPLAQKLREPITRYEFFLLMMQMAEIPQRLQKINLSPAKLIADINHIYINEKTKELQFVYLPVIMQGGANLLQMIRSVAAVVKVAQPGAEVAGRFIGYLNGLQWFDVNSIEQTIMQLDRGAYTAVKRLSTAGSEYMTGRPKDPPEQYGNATVTPQQQYAQQYAQQQYAQPQYAQPRYAQQQYAQPQYAQPRYAQPQYAQPQYEQPQYAQPQYEQPRYEQPQYAPNDDDPTGILREGADEESTGILRGVIDVIDDDGPTMVPVPGMTPKPAAAPAFAPAMEPVAAEADETSLLDETPPVIIHYPTLCRLLTQERIQVDKPVFRVGKERSYVDYFIGDNSHISRSHADIITRDGKYYIVDLNSKNKTYVNGRMLLPTLETEIRDGDRLRLANEDFTFTV